MQKLTERLLPRLLSLAATGLLGLAVYWSLRLGYADWLAHSESVESLQRAAHLAPGNARYRVWLAATLDWQGRSVEAEQAIERAVELNPWEWASWMDVGLRAELAGDFGRAERCLLEAARVKRGYEPRWTLLNYYYRRGDEESFWKWARSATAMSYGDGSLLFRLYWRMSRDPDLILQRAIPIQKAAQADQISPLAKYVAFLLGDNHPDAAEPAAMKLASLATKDELPVLLATCDRMLETGNLPAAMHIWGAMCARNLAPYHAPQPERGLSLTNGDFAKEPLLHGFDWRVHSPEGVTVYRGQSPPALRVAFSGRQAENCEIVSQMLPLVPGRDYRIRFRYQTSEIPPNAGLRWRVIDAAKNVELTHGAVQLSSDKKKEEEILFSTVGHAWPPATPGGTGEKACPTATLARLALAYRRALGTTRIEGWVSLSDITLEFAP